MTVSVSHLRLEQLGSRAEKSLIWLQRDNDTNELFVGYQ